MKAAARLVVDEGRLVVMESSPPLVLRATPGAVYVIGGAYTPLGGDDLSLLIEVGEGQGLVVRSAAASVALPGPEGAPSRLRVTASVAARASLEWHPEPGVAAAGCDHRNDAAVDLAGDARLLWRDDVVLGRHGEEPGRWRSALSVDLDGRALLRHEIELGGGTDWASPAVGGGMRTHTSVLTVHREPVVPPGATAMVLAGTGVLAVAVSERLG